MEKSSAITAFTDGACLGNPGPGGWAYVMVFPSGEVRELAGYEANSTNNKMELRAVVECLKAAKEKKLKVVIYLDSQYVIHGADRVSGNSKNADLWKELFSLLKPMRNRVTFKKVPGHRGIPGNERADRIASAMSARKDPDLFRGFLNEYRYPVLEGLDFESESNNEPFYLSLVGGIAKTHKTWSECEAVVKGQKGAKFKKVFTQSEADRLIKEWNKA